MTSLKDFLIKKPINRLLPIFSPDFTLYSQIRLFYAEKWIFLKTLRLDHGICILILMKQNSQANGK